MYSFVHKRKVHQRNVETRCYDYFQKYHLKSKIRITEERVEMATTISDQFARLNIRRGSEPNYQSNHSPQTEESKKAPTMMDTKKSGLRCKFFEMGCDFNVRGDQLEILMSHTENSTEYHLELTIDAYRYLKSENEVIKKKYNKLKFEWNNYHMRLGGYNNNEKLNSNVRTKKISQPNLRKMRLHSPGNKSDCLDVNYDPNMKRARSAEINILMDKDNEGKKAEKNVSVATLKPKLLDEHPYYKAIAINKTSFENRESEEKWPEWMMNGTGSDAYWTKDVSVETKL